MSLVPVDTVEVNLRSSEKEPGYMMVASTAFNPHWLLTCRRTYVFMRSHDAWHVERRLSVAR